ncbi:hypothetical protein B0H14DRAFT_2611484 [Mycena olivaceomarginata]|nr:hypothetical protein B0H14DRAFT_2611484 [Mycena olivaceomarginata]
MKFTTILSVLTVVAAVGAARVNTNAARFARGLPPIAPVKRGSSVAGARRGSPSGTPPAQCKPLLQTCSAHSDCCSDLCILNVRFPLLKFLNSEAPFNSSFAPDYRAEILRCSWVLPLLVAFAISLSSSARNSGIGDTGKVTGGIIGSI